MTRAHFASSRVVLDTNVLVAAGFRRNSAAATIVAAIRDGQCELVWDDATRNETRHILQKIPPLDWSAFAGLYTDTTRFAREVPTADLDFVADPADRKFAALARAAEATLVTNDDHLLAVRDQFDFDVLTPGEWVRRRGS